MIITILRQAFLFYEHYSTESGGFCFMNIVVLRQAVLLYEVYNTETGGFAL
jgi:hypothetical protein